MGFLFPIELPPFTLVTIVVLAIFNTLTLFRVVSHGVEAENSGSRVERNAGKAALDGIDDEQKMEGEPSCISG